MKQYYLSIDIGASSGRHILGWMENGKISTEEIYRFKNELILKNGHLCWDLDLLWAQIIFGMQKCHSIGKIPTSMSIDTWAVDFVLLDKDNRRLGDAISYRDHRTEGMIEKVNDSITENELYKKTGIQKQAFNSIYQLMAIKCKQTEQMEKAASLLMIPDFFHFKLSGVKAVEYTNATTTQLVSPITGNWDIGLIERLGYPSEIFTEIKHPGDLLGNLTKEVQNSVGFDTQVVLCATHDTGSAVLAVPAISNDVMYISSGTWSLMGVERNFAACDEMSKEYNFTNEGGYDKRFRYLKNIMGLWMIQFMKKEFDDEGSFEELCELASKERITSIVNCNDSSFLAPESMVVAIQDFCKVTGQEIPKSKGEIAAVIYNSLANCYHNTAEEIETLTGKSYDVIHVIGGGANAEYLNHLTAIKTGKRVLAGPAEATAIGNLVAQMIYKGVFKNIWEAKACISKSFEIKIYEP